MRAYGATDLEEILHSMHPQAASVLEDKVVTFVAQKAAFSKGDARIASSMLDSVITAWKSSSSSKKTKADVAFAKRVLAETNPQGREIFDGLPRRQKEFLAVVVKLSKEENVDGLKAAHVESVFTKQMMLRSFDDGVEASEASNMIFSSLDDNGFISFPSTCNGYPERHHNIDLKISAAQIETFMDTHTSKFYAGIV